MIPVFVRTATAAQGKPTPEFDDYEIYLRPGHIHPPTSDPKDYFLVRVTATYSSLQSTNSQLSTYDYSQVRCGAFVSIEVEPGEFEWSNFGKVHPIGATDAGHRYCLRSCSYRNECSLSDKVFDNEDVIECSS